MMRDLMANPDLNKLIEDQGYAVVNLLDESDVDRLEQLYQNLKPDNEKPFYTSNMIPDADHRKEVSDKLLPILIEKASEHFDNCKFVYSYFLVKQGSSEGLVSMHQDWTLIDEVKHRGLTMWCPLTDTTEENGTLNLIKYSHKIFDNTRGHNIDLPYLDYVDELVENYLSPIYLKAGQAVLFDHRLVHASFPNLGSKVRVAVGMTILPKEAEFIHHYKSLDNGRVSVYNSDDDFLINFGFQESPDKLNFVEEVEYNPESISLQSFKDQYKQFWLKENAYKQVTRQVFTDAALSEKIQDDGFVVKQLLDQNTIRECVDLFNKVDPKLDKGFYTSLESANREYRDQVNNEINELVGHHILTPFDHYKPIGYTFNIKLPKPDSETPVHLDDCHVDEKQFVSINVWIPLVDTNLENGTLHIIPKSHKIPHAIRALGMGFPYQESFDVLSEKFIAMPLNAGEVLFFDSRIIHWAPPNMSGKVRPALVTGLIPEESQPIVFMHYDGLKKNRLEKFHAPFDFFSSVEIGKRPEGYKSLGIFEYIAPAISAEEILSYLE